MRFDFGARDVEDDSRVSASRRKRQAGATTAVRAPAVERDAPAKGMLNSRPKGVRGKREASRARRVSA